MNHYPEPIVGTFIFNDKDEILLIEYAKRNNQYTVPGGHIEIGETIAEAVVREAKEEVGLDVEFVEVFNCQENIFDPHYYAKKHFIFLDCLCRAKTTVTKCDGREAISCRWFKIGDALKLQNLSETTREPLIKFRKRFTEMKNDK